MELDLLRQSWDVARLHLDWLSPTWTQAQEACDVEPGENPFSRHQPRCSLHPTTKQDSVRRGRTICVARSAVQTRTHFYPSQCMTVGQVSTAGTGPWDAIAVVDAA